MSKNKSICIQFFEENRDDIYTEDLVCNVPRTGDTVQFGCIGNKLTFTVTSVMWVYDDQGCVYDQPGLSYDRVHVRMAPTADTKTTNNHTFVQKCLHAYGDALQHELSNIDGASIRRDLDSIAAMLHEDSLVPTFDEWIDITGLTEKENGTYSWE